MGKTLDLEGLRFGRLIVIKKGQRIGPIGKNKYYLNQWICKCDCGNTHQTSTKYLRAGEVNSCGCLNKEQIRKMSTKHGKSNTKEYIAWEAMKARCYNKNQKKWEDYGGRGIIVQETWIKDFQAFIDYIGFAPSAGHSVDRIDTNGNYVEGNVRWALPPAQSQNMRKPRTGTNKYKWVHLNIRTGNYVARFLMNGTLHRVGTFQSEEVAAKKVYSYYKDLTGEWPKYIDNALIELGLINAK